MPGSRTRGKSTPRRDGEDDAGGRACTFPRYHPVFLNRSQCVLETLGYRRRSWEYSNPRLRWEKSYVILRVRLIGQSQCLQKRWRGRSSGRPRGVLVFLPLVLDNDRGRMVAQRCYIFFNVRTNPTVILNVHTPVTHPPPAQAHGNHHVQLSLCVSPLHHYQESGTLNVTITGRASR